MTVCFSLRWLTLWFVISLSIIFTTGSWYQSWLQLSIRSVTGWCHLLSVSCTADRSRGRKTQGHWLGGDLAPRTIARQAPLSMGFPFPSPGDLPNTGIEPASLALAGGFFTTESPGKPYECLRWVSCSWTTSTEYRRYCGEKRIVWCMFCQLRAQQGPAVQHMELRDAPAWMGEEFWGGRVHV